MKRAVFLTLFLATILFASSAISMQKTQDEHSSVLDVIVEYTPEGSIVQIGNKMVVVPSNIVVDNGTGVLTPAGKESLSVGKFAKATLTIKDDDGFWHSSFITIFEGAGIDQALELLDDEGKASLRTRLAKYTGVPSAEEQDKAVEQPAEPMANQSLRLENGVWTN